MGTYQIKFASVSNLEMFRETMTYKHNVHMFKRVETLVLEFKPEQGYHYFAVLALIEHDLKEVIP
jgi:hypothetical protein